MWNAISLCTGSEPYKKRRDWKRRGDIFKRRDTIQIFQYTNTVCLLHKQIYILRIAKLYSSVQIDMCHMFLGYMIGWTPNHAVLHPFR